MDTSVSLPNKKAYHEPKLAVYGSITHLTRALGTTKSNKDGGSNNTKTAA